MADNNYTFDTYLDGGTVTVHSDKDNATYYINKRMRDDDGVGAVFCCYPTEGPPIDCMPEYVRAKRILSASVVDFKYPNHLNAIANALIWIDEKMEEEKASVRS